MGGIWARDVQNRWDKVTVNMDMGWSICKSIQYKCFALNLLEKNMKRFFITFTLFTVLAILPAAYFAQSSDDTDGDGIKNSEDLCPNDKGSKANKGCPRDDEEQTPENLKTGSKLSDEQPFSDCKFIIEDEGCRKFYGSSASELRSIFGQFPPNGEYPELGVQFYLWGQESDKLEALVGEIKFYGPDEKTVRPFAGLPGKKIGWNATREDIIKTYGEPTGEQNWNNAFKIVELSYNDTLKIKLVDGKIYTVTIIYDKYKAESSAYYTKLENEKKARVEKERLAKLQAELERKTQANKTLEERLKEYRDKQKEKDDGKTSEEAKDDKYLEELDSLKSNIDILATPKPTPTTTNPTKPVSAENGNFADCKLILSEGCRNYFFQTNIDAIQRQLGFKAGSYNQTLSMQVYNWAGIELYVEPSSGRVITIRIDEYVKDWKPNKNLKWGEGMSKTQEKQKGGKYTRTYSGESLIFLNYILLFRDGKLIQIEFEQPLTASESATKATREKSDDAIALERYRAENTPEAQKAKMMSDYKEAMSYLREYSQKIDHYYLNGDREKVKLYQGLALSTINRFLERYDGKMSKEMKEQFLGFKAQLTEPKQPN